MTETAYRNHALPSTAEKSAWGCNAKPSRSSSVLSSRTLALCLVALLAAPALAGCLGADEDEEKILRVLTYDAFGFTESDWSDFGNDSGFTIEVTKVDDAGAVLARAIQTSDAGSFDLIIGIDNSFLQAGLDAGIFADHGLGDLPDFHAEATTPYSGDEVVPYDWGRVCLNYDNSYADGTNVSVPETLWDLTGEDWNGKVAFQNPRTSSPGRSFLLATVDYFANDADESTDFADWWSAMNANDAIVTDGWSEAYEVHYSAGYGQWYDGFVGDAKAVVSYCHSPGVEAYFGENYTTSAALALDRAAWVQVEYMGIAAASDMVSEAQSVMRWILDDSVQPNMGTMNYMYPATADATLPTENGYLWHTGVPQQDASLSPSEVAAGIDSWLDSWDSAMA